MSPRVFYVGQKGSNKRAIQNILCFFHLHFIIVLFWKSTSVTLLFKQFTSSLWPGWGSLIFISIDILICFISLIKSEHLSFFLSFFFILLFLHLCTHLESPEGIAWHALLPSLSCSPSLFVLILCQWLLRHNRTWLAVTVSTATGLWDQIRSSAEELAVPQPERLKHCGDQKTCIGIYKTALRHYQRQYM